MAMLKNVFLLALFLFSQTASAAFSEVVTPDTDSLYSQVMTAYHAQAQNSPATDGNDLPPYPSPDSMMNAVIGDALTRADKELSLVSMEVSPFVALPQIGHIAIDAADVMLSKATTGKLIQARDLLGPFWMGTATMLLGVGYLLALALPLIPFIFFMTGATSWLIHTVTGVSSVGVHMFLCLAGDEGTRRHYGELLASSLVDALLRPSILVIAFVISAAASTVVLKFLLIGMLPQIFAYTPSGLIGVYAKIILLFGLARLSVAVVSVVFGMIARMPDEVIKFLGMQAQRIRIG
ncbi:hypothetical protein G4F23_004608 [Salmonella enterica]|nr:hypothetical protein [Salmonella enterica]EEH8327260.1 hypothetical protein [Salmonella enterica]